MEVRLSGAGIAHYLMDMSSLALISMMLFFFTASAAKTGHTRFRIADPAHQIRITQHGSQQRKISTR